MKILIKIINIEFLFIYIKYRFQFSILGTNDKYLFGIYFDNTTFIIDLFYKEIIIKI